MSTTTDIDFDAVRTALHARGIDAYVEQTGGGCATIYAGPTHEEPGWGKRWACLAGPGWFDGPGWTNPKGDPNDFYIGPDDDGVAEAWSNPLRTTDATEIADVIARQVAAA